MPKYYPFIIILAFTSLGGCALVGAMWFVDHRNLTEENERLRSSIVLERDYKAKLQELLDTNLNASNELVAATDTLIGEVQDYNSSVKSSFRYLNGKVELLPGADGKVLMESQQQVDLELENTEAKIQKSIQLKDNTNDQISRIFGTTDQNLQRRADPRDGAKN